MRVQRVLQALFLMITTTVFGFSGFVHLHTNDFKNSFPVLKSNKVWKNLQKSGSYNEFKSSKLYYRLSEEFSRINKDHDYLTEDFLSQIPASNADFYLMDIGSLSFLISFELDKAQMETISKLNSETLPNKKVGEYDVFEKGGIFISFYKNRTLIASDISFISDYITDGSDFETIKPQKGYSNTLYLDMKKILSTPYLKTYWFIKDKSPLLTTKEVSISFNITKKEFSEVGKIVYTTPLTENIEESRKKIEIDSILSIINLSTPFSWRFFDKIDFINYFMTNTGEVVLAPFSGTLDDLKKVAMDKHKSSLWKEESGVVEVSFGVLNREKIYLTLKDGYLLGSTEKDLLSKVKVVDSNFIKELNIKSTDFVKKMASKTSDSERSNLSYSNFIKNFITPYFSGLSTFSHKYFIKEGNGIFETKITF